MVKSVYCKYERRTGYVFQCCPTNCLLIGDSVLCLNIELNSFSRFLIFKVMSKPENIIKTQPNEYLSYCALLCGVDNILMKLLKVLSITLNLYDVYQQMIKFLSYVDVLQSPYLKNTKKTTHIAFNTHIYCNTIIPMTTNARSAVSVHAKSLHLLYLNIMQ